MIGSPPLLTSKGRSRLPDVVRHHGTDLLNVGDEGDIADDVALEHVFKLQWITQVKTTQVKLSTLNHKLQARHPFCGIGDTIGEFNPEQDGRIDHRFAAVDRLKTENWGEVCSVRVWYAGGPEVEFAVASPDWARRPLDEGTARVLQNGFRSLYDPLLLLSPIAPAPGRDPAEVGVGEKRGTLS